MWCYGPYGWGRDGGDVLNRILIPAHQLLVTRFEASIITVLHRLRSRCILCRLLFTHYSRTFRYCLSIGVYLSSMANCQFVKYGGRRPNMALVALLDSAPLSNNTCDEPSTALS